MTDGRDTACSLSRHQLRAKVQIPRDQFLALKMATWNLSLTRRDVRRGAAVTSHSGDVQRVWAW